MPIYEYEGIEYDIETEDHAEAKNKILKHLGRLPTVSKSKAAESGFLNTVLQMSGSLNESLFPSRQTNGYPGGLTASEFTANQAMEDVSKAAQDHPLITGTAGAAPLLMPMIPMAPLSPALGAGGGTAFALGQQIIPRAGLAVPMYHSSAGSRKTELMEGDATKRENAEQGARTGAIVDTALGVALPGGYSRLGSGMASTVAQRAATGAIMQPIAGAAGDVAMNADTKDRDVKQVDPLDPQRRLPEAIFGAALGPMAGHTVGKTKMQLEAAKLVNELTEALKAKPEDNFNKARTIDAIKSADDQAHTSERALYGIMRTFDKLKDIDPIKANDFLQTVLPEIKNHIDIIKTDLPSISTLTKEFPDHGISIRNKGDLVVNKIIDKFDLPDDKIVGRAPEFSWDEVPSKGDASITRDELVAEFSKEQGITKEEAEKMIAFDKKANNISEQVEDVSPLGIKPLRTPQKEVIFDKRPAQKQPEIEFPVREDTDVYQGKWDGETQITKLSDDINFNNLPTNLKTPIEKALKTLGLDSEMIQFTYGTGDRTQVNYGKDGSFRIHLNPEGIPKRVLAKYGNLNPTDLQNLSFAWSIAHELGHIVLFKSIQTDVFGGKALTVAAQFKRWAAKNKAEAGKAGQVVGIRDFESTAEYYRQFHEFFAQRTAEALLNPGKHNIASGFVHSIKHIWNTLVKDYKLPVNTFKAADDLIKDIVQANKKSIEDFGRTLWEVESVKRSYDEVTGINKMFNEYPTRNFEAPVPKSADEALKTAMTRNSDATPYALKALFHIASHGFGLQQKKNIFAAYPEIQFAVDTITNKLNEQVSNAARLLQGTPSKVVNGKRIWSLTRSEAKDSVKVLLKESTDVDVHKVLELFQEGIDRLTYQENLAKNGHRLTEHQKKLFISLSTMFTHMKGLAGGSIPKSKKGWYPSVRNGDYVVVINKPGATRVRSIDDGALTTTTAAHVQTFFSKREAENFVKWFKELPDNERGNMFTEGVTLREKNDTSEQLVDRFHEELQQFLYNANSATAHDVSVKAQELKDQYLQRTNGLAGHRKLRLNIPGYKGNEFDGTVGERGKAFREAIFSSVNEYTTLIMKNQIHKELGVLTDNAEFSRKHPESHSIISTLREYATNEYAVVGKEFGKSIDSLFDYSADLVREKFMKGVGVKPTYGQVHLSDATVGKVSRLFYIYALIGRPSFWAAQAVQFMWAGRTVAKEGSLFDMFTAGGKGILTAATQTKDFKEALMYVKENKHTFHPQFINDLNTFKMFDLKEGSASLHALEIMLGEKQSTAADTFSRYMSFAILYEHYKSQGLNGKELWDMAANKTDENMVQYGRQYKAPIFQKFGMAGNLAAPLQTFSQAALGNFISDVGHLLRTPAGKGKLKAAMPAFFTMNLSMLMAGAIAAPVIAELVVLNELYNYLAREFDMPEMPSIKEYIMHGGNDFSNRVLSNGLVSASTMAVSDEGFDIGSSLQWQPVFVGMATGEKAFLDYLPALKWAGQQAGHIKTMAKDKLSDEDIPTADVRTAFKALMPSGPIRALASMAKFGTEEAIYDTKGAMKRKNTGGEQLATFLGTKTLTGKIEEQRRFHEKTKTLQQGDIKTRLIKTLVDSIETKNKEQTKTIVNRLIKIGMEPDSIKNAIETELIKRKVPEGVRQFVGKSGKVSNRNAVRYINERERYGVDPITGEEIDE